MTVGRADALLGAHDVERLRGLLGIALDALHEGRTRRGGPLPAGGPSLASDDVAAALRGDVLPERGVGPDTALAEIGAAFVAGACEPSDPACAGHLHTPPLAVAIAADMLASAVNASLDSWDQGPSGIAVENEVLAALAALCGLDPARAGGAMTSGGTASNLTALHLAREHVGSSLRIVCSELAHFSVQRAAAVLGLGEHAVTTVPTDDEGRLDPAALERSLASEPATSAVVATAGTTDLGSIDPLRQVARVAARHGAWCHVDAAYGGGALFSRRLAPLLDGIAEADSVGLDLHKLGWQPVAAGVLLVRDRALLTPLERRVAYLTVEDDELAGYPNMLGRSLRTTRRADALKLAVSLRALGRRGLEDLVDACHELARHAADAISLHPRLELLAAPVLTTVLFRYRPEGPADPDVVNARIRRRLLEEGTAVLGRTQLAGSIALKLTLLHPDATRRDLESVLSAVVDAGGTEERAR